MDTTALSQQVVRGEAYVAGKHTRIQHIAHELRAVGHAVQPAQTHGFWRDVFSDQNGVSFHRFQIGMWTVVLAIIFIHTVYDGLAMPDFDAQAPGVDGAKLGDVSGLQAS